MKQAVNTELEKTKIREPRVTKKEQIVELFTSGVTNVSQVAKITDASLSYVSTVLQDAGLLTGYFDLYTTTANPMNVYSRRFVNKLGFRNEETAQRSVRELDTAYQQFEQERDRAGQHHTLEMALIMFDRARWTGKPREAQVFRNWLVRHLDLPDTTESPA